jgi:hypothetical protein
MPWKASSPNSPDAASNVACFAPAAINRFLAETNSDPKPLVWTADPERVLAAVNRGKETLESLH